jgi:cytidine deaminase
MTALTDAAWAVRDNAHLHGPTAVGVAVLSDQGNVYTGCNIEHRFRSHDIHAEVNALSAMVAAGDGPAVEIVIAADRTQFTPCGSCLDWIFELGGPKCMVKFGPSIWYADELMPWYPA